MGRVSKRKTVAQEIKSIPEGKTFRAGIYARLSSDQNQKKNESIEVQIEIAKKFVEDYNRENTGELIEVVQCYTDLGKTGSNFEREGFLRLLQDVRLGDINCVIVKDLSRFGRNYLEAGNYIEKIFPFLGVRFIAVSDGFDTGKNNKNQQMASEIRNLVNDMYAKDSSKKAKLHLQQRREEGSYVGGPAPYGYVAVWEGKIRVLKPDENTAEIVRFIYEKFVETESYWAVANELNKRKINPPGVYKKSKEVYYSSDYSGFKGWDSGAVRRILKSDTYHGTLAQGKTSITARDEKNRTKKPEEEWCIIRDIHEPLIDNELFQKSKQAHQRIKERTNSCKNHTEGCPIEENIFDSVLYCGVCGRKMTRSSYVKQCHDGSKVRMDGYFCLNGKSSKVTVCPESNRISKHELISIIMPLIRTEYAVFLKKPQYYMTFGNERMAESVKKEETVLREIERKISYCLEEESKTYMDYRLGKIPQKEYVSFKMKQENRVSDLRKQKENQENKIKELKKLSAKYLAAIKSLLKLKSGQELTREMIEAFISKIYVYPGKRIEVLFSFTVDCLEGMKR